MRCTVAPTYQEYRDEIAALVQQLGETQFELSETSLDGEWEYVAAFDDILAAIPANSNFAHV